MKALITINQRYWLLLTVSILVGIMALSLWPLDALPRVPGNDKTHHFIAYAALMLPSALRQPRYWLLILVSLIAYGGVVELLQPYANRYAEWLDFAANSAGILCGAIVGKLLSSYYNNDNPARIY